MSAFTITPSDTDAINKPYKHLYVGGTGNIAVKDRDGNSVVLNSVPVGQLVDFAPNMVLATGTTATNLRGME